MKESILPVMERKNIREKEHSEIKSGLKNSESIQAG